MNDTGFSSQPDRLTRFDSVNSSMDYNFGGPEKLSRFDSVNSSRDFGGGPEKLTRFDSVNSSAGFYSFDDHDPFGASGPFKVSSSSDSKDKF